MAGVDDDGDWVRGGSDGAPGVAGLDEDGDGHPDDITGPYATPEIGANATNSIDDDGDGVIDDGPTDPAGMPEPYGPGDDHDLNNNGVPDPGEPNVDETDEFIAGAPDPAISGDAGSVVGDDIDLDRDGDRISHLVPTDPDPTPNVVDNPVEPQANAAETTLQDHFRTLDWANPGKQHGPDRTVLTVPYGEVNAYDD